MKRVLAAMVMLPLTASCGLPVDQLVGAVVSRTQIPPRIFLLCAPVLRNVDIQAIVIEINAGRDENVTKTAAIANADTTCNETATRLLAIATESQPASDVQTDPTADSTTDSSTAPQVAPLLDFNALDAANFETDCKNCYVAIIDSLYDN